MRDFFPRFFFSLVHSTRFYAQIWKFDSSTVCVSRDSITIVDRRLKAIYIRTTVLLDYYPINDFHTIAIIYYSQSYVGEKI